MLRCTHSSCQSLHRCAFRSHLHRHRSSVELTGPCLPRVLLSSHDASRSVTGHPRPARQQTRDFHEYFVTHLPSSSLHPDARSSAGPRHQLPRSASLPHKPSSNSSSNPAPAPAIGPHMKADSTSPGVGRDTTVVRIPLRSAKHHFGAAVSRGQRPYNEDAFQAGVIEIPAFAKRAPVSLSRSRANPTSPLAEYRRRQAEGDKKRTDNAAMPDAPKSALGDPQVFYFGVFDGHGGSECSEFLRDRLHGYVETAAKGFGLKSSLQKSVAQTEAKTGGEEKSEDSKDNKVGRRRMASGGRPGETETHDRPEAASKQEDPKRPSSGSDDKSGPPKSSDAAEQGVDQEKAKELEADLLYGWKKTVGGYFRRFKPALLYDAQDQSKSGADISTILTYAFLRADLDFIVAQSRKPIQGAKDDPVVEDKPINSQSMLSGEGEVHIGGPQRFEGGSTSSVAIISTPTPTPFWHPTTPATMIFAHVGDTRILLCRTSDGLAVPCTSNHHPSSPIEGKRLRRFSGEVVTDSFGEERISGLANTRAFGDMRSKRVGVSAEPEVTRVEMTAAEYSFMVLMSDGISGTLSDQEVVDIVKESRTPDEGAKDVVSFAIEVTSEGDNATCLVVRLGGWERRNEGGLGSMGTKESRDWRKEDASQPRSRRT